jgi:hypothetical protein
MNAPVRISFSEEMALANRIADALVAAGIMPEDEHYSELMASETDIQNRLLRILRVARLTEAHSTALKQLETDMRVRRDRLDNKAVRLRGIVLQAMSDLGLKRLEGPDLTVTAAAGRPKVIVTEEAKIPERFWVTSRALDKKALAAALKDEAVDGAELSNGGDTLTIRGR